MSEGRVYILDDDKAVRDSLSWLLESAGLNVVGFAAADELFTTEIEYPSCLILDVRMPGVSGLDVLDRLVVEQSDLPVIMVTGHADVPMAIRAMKSGAFEFIEKPYNDQLLIDRVNAAISHSARQLDTHTSLQQIADRFNSLTARESEVLEFIVDGNSNKQIAALLNLSIKTIEVHRSHIMEKTQAGSLAELLRMYYQISK